MMDGGTVMTTVGSIFDALNEFCPFEIHEPWDNVGLLVGERDTAVKKAAVVLDITADAVEAAHGAGAQLVVSHHPVIFNSLKKLDSRDPVYLLAKYGMSAVCAHTNLDCAEGGVNDVLARVLGLSDVEKIPSSECAEPLLRAGRLQSPMSPEELAKLVSDKLSCHVRFSSGARNISRVALCGGAGGEFFADAAAAGCEALVTGDAAHHEFLGAAAAGVTLVAAGHFETENPVVPTLAEYLSRRLPEAEFFVLPQQPPAKFI